MESITEEREIEATKVGFDEKEVSTPHNQLISTITNFKLQPNTRKLQNKTKRTNLQRKKRQK